MLESTLETLLPAMGATTVERLTGHENGYFARLGRGDTTTLVDQLLTTCLNDVRSARPCSARAALKRWIGHHAREGLVFHDLRSCCAHLRSTVLQQLNTHLETLPYSQVEIVENWFHELLALCAQFYAAQREATIRDQQSRLELQLAELRDLTERHTSATRLLEEIWVPIAPVYKGVLVVPLVGTVNQERVTELLERLLAMVARQGARFVILDITGVPIVDTAIAHSLIHLVQAVRLLGAETILVGIVPEIAQTIVQLGIDFTQMTTRSSLDEGLLFALRRMGLSITASSSVLKGA